MNTPNEGYPGIAHDLETMRQQRDELAAALRAMVKCAEAGVTTYFGSQSGVLHKARTALTKAKLE